MPKPNQNPTSNFGLNMITGVSVAAVAVICVLGYRFWQPIAKKIIDPKAPRVALSMDREWHGQLGLSTKNYEICLTAAGAAIHAVDVENENVEDVLNSVDAVVIGAGGDIHPSLYSSTQDEPTGLDLARDKFEIQLARGAYARNMPLIGVCHGNQLLNVAFGGRLRSLVENESDEIVNRHGPGIHSLDAHSVLAEPNTKMAELLGDREARVSSFHGMAVSQPGDVLKVTAKCKEDGVIEGVEAKDQSHRLFMGTQFHPEFPPYTMQSFFDRLVSEARDYRAEKEANPSKSQTDNKFSYTPRSKNE